MPTFAKNPTPEYQQARAAILQRRGKDPSKFDIDLETGKIIELPSSLESAGVGAAYNVPDAAVGGAGLAVAQRVLAGIPATSIPGVIAKVGGTLAAPFIANMLANKAGMQEGKQALMPSLAEKYEISAQANPLSTELGGIASGVAGGMRPSISNIGRAGSAIRGLAAGVPFKRLPVAQSGALVNVGAGTALGGGIPAAQSAIAGDFDLAKTLIGAGGGAFLSEPNKLGRAMGFKPTPSVDTSMQLPADRSRLAPTASEQMPQPYRDLMARTADLQDTQMSFTDKVTDETGAEVRGKFTPSVKPLEQSLIAVSERAGLHDTPPHEILHGILLDLQASGNPNERALAQRALAAAGGEESLIQAAGEEMSARMTPGGREGIISDLTSLVRDRFLRRGTKGDYARILANIMQRQGAMRERTGVTTTPPIPKQEAPPEPVMHGPENLPTPEYSTLDTGEQTYSETGFEGYKPPSPPMRIPKQPTEDAYWETAGGEYPQPFSTDEEVASQIRQRDFAAARKEKLIQDEQERAAREALSNPYLAKVLKESLEQRQMEGAIEQPRGKVTDYTRQSDYGPGRNLPQEGPRTEAERIQDELEGSGAKYQRFGPTKDQVADVPSRGLNPFEGEASKLERVGPHHASLASAFRSVNDARRSFNGRYANPMIEAFERLPNESRARLYETLIDESRGGKPLRTQLTTAEERAAYDVVRTVIRQMAQDQIAAGQPVWTKKGSRPRGMNPMYFPNVMAGEIRRILAEAPGTQAFSDLRREFITHQMANKISQAVAEQRFEDLLGDFANNPASNPAKFGGVRMPEGVGLPDSWIEKDPIKAIRSYSNRFSRDRAFWDVIETKPELMQMLGSSKYGDQQPIPATLSGPNLIRDPQVQNLLRDFFGTAQVGTEPVFKGAARLATGALVGPGSKIADVSTVPFKSLAYAPSTSSGINAVLRGLADWRGGYERAFETGLNRRGGLVVATDLLGFGERVNQTLMTVTEALTKYTGAEQLELASRGLSQSIGEYIGDSWQTLARNNDPKAIEFLAKLQADATTPRAELGTRIAQLLQGRYDATNLPAMALSGPISPFFALQRWSVEQLNNFQRFAIQPALQGDFRPAIAQILAGLTGGLVINEIREAVSGKKSQTATWKELEVGKGKPGYADAVAYKLINAAQITGTIGIVTEITKQLYEAGTKRQVQGLNFPLISVGADAISRVMAGAAAISEGQDAMEVTKAVANDILKNNIQAYRLARNALGRTGLNEQATRDLERNNENRDLQVWSQMEGRPTGVPTQTQPSYSRLSEKEFDQATPREAVSMAPELFKEAVRSSNNNPSVLAQRLRQMKSIKVEGMPNPETNPTDAVKYFNWIKQTQGPEEASRLWKEFQKRQAEAKFKRQLIPSFSAR